MTAIIVPSCVVESAESCWPCRSMSMTSIMERIEGMIMCRVQRYCSEAQLWKKEEHAARRP